MNTLRTLVIRKLGTEILIAKTSNSLSEVQLSRRSMTLQCLRASRDVHRKGPKIRCSTTRRRHHFKYRNAMKMSAQSLRPGDGASEVFNILRAHCGYYLASNRSIRDSTGHRWGTHTTPTYESCPDSCDN